MALVEINGSDLVDLTDGDISSLVYVWAPWCGPCKMMSPMLGQVAEEHADKMDFFKLNADDNTATLEKYGISSTPTILVFVQGDVVQSIVGARPKAKLLEELAEFL
jgi:thioredoxin 1